MLKNLLSGTAIAAILVLPFFRASQEDPLKAADAAFQKKEYASALAGYQAAAKLPEFEKDREHIHVRIGVALARLQRWDEALAALETFTASKPSQLGFARALTERGVIAATMPHNAYVKDGKRTRGEWVQGATYLWTAEEDSRAAVLDLERATEVYGLLFEAATSEPPAARRRLADERVRADLELAAALESGQSAVLPKENPASRPATWSDRMIAAFDRAIATATAADDRETESLCRYLKGAACARLLPHYQDIEHKAGGEIWHRPHPSADAVARVKLPRDRNPLAVLSDAAARAEGTKLAAETLMALASLQKQLGLFVDAVKTCERIVRDHAKSPYAQDAREDLEQMTFPRVSLEPTHAALPGAPFALEAQVRNVKEITVTISAFALEQIYRSASWLEDGGNAFGNPEQTYAALIKTGATARRVATIRHATRDDGVHRPLTEKIEVPALEAGAYLVEATGSGVTWRSLVLVSDLSLAAKFDRERIVTFAVDALSGKPVQGVDVVVRQRHHNGNRTFVRHDTGSTDARGIFVQPRDARDAWVHVECFAAAGNRIAMIDRAWWGHHGRGQNRTTAYVMTDRPVYRPGDPIRIAAVVRQHLENLEYQALANRAIRMLVHDPKGQLIFDQLLKTDGSGAFSQEIAVGKDAPLGQYNVRLQRDGNHVQNADFRIEEYLKPEFEVTVELPKEQLRLGSKVPVNIDAQYYFGGGVPGAEVTWRVFREEYYPYFSWHRHWMAENDAFVHRRGGGRELVASGQGATSSDGALQITFDTERYATTTGHGSRFVVEADVMDASRRTISGSALLLLPRHALVLGLEPRRGFYVAGDTVECETQSRLPAGAPAAAVGTIRVFEITQKTKPNGQLEETRREIHAEPHATDAKGVGFFRWQPDVGGYFAIVFEAPDKFEQLVTGEARLWVYKPGALYRDFAFANLELIPDRRSFAPGQVAKVLVRSALPEGSVLYAIEAGDTMLHWDVLALDGRLGVIEVPIEKRHMPNVHVHVLAVSGGRFFEDRVELFVPPDDRFLDVKLAYAKDAFRPGDVGDLVVTTATSTGAPVSARVAVTVLDASILAIQADDSQDIRKFFYGARRPPNVHRDSSAGLSLRGYLAKDVTWGRYETVGGLPAWGGPQPGFVSNLFRGEGFGLKELESWGLERAKDRRTIARGAPRGRAAGALAADVASGPPAAKAVAENSEDDGPREEKLGFVADELGMREGAKDDADAPPKARKDFRDSALWAADVTTDATGRTTIKVPFPESLTTWRAKAWAWTNDTLVGQGTADVKTTKDVLVRLRAPRFFVEGDAITVAALVNNRTGKPQQAKVRITLDDHLRTRQPLEVTVEVAPNADRRVDWTVDVVAAGTTTIAAQVVAEADQDALEMTYPVLEWGSDKVLTQGAVLQGDANAELAFTIPAERRVETTSLELSLQPSLLLTLVDALPYLVDFPYGCTEQTTSRFIPAAIVAKLLGDAGVTLEDLAAARGGASKERAKDHARRILTSAELQTAVRAGIDRLASMQHGDGGFGWWKDGDGSPYLTAYVLQGLVIAREADLPVPSSMFDRAIAFLAAALPKEQQLEQATFIAYVLARAGKPDAAVLDRIFRNRDALNIYGKALLTSALKAAGKNDEALSSLRNLADFAVRDQERGTAHFGATSRQWWWWWNNLVETNAAVLNAFVDVDPKHELARPLVTWLVTNRRGGRWHSTRDTAQAIFALARYAKASGELDPELAVEVRVNGGAPRALAIDKKNLWLFDGRMLFLADQVPSGDVRVAITTRGKGRLYATGFARFFTKEADITGAGNDLLVARSYARVTQKPQTKTEDGREIVEMVDAFEALASGAEIRAGDVVEVRLKVDAKNDYDYIFIEDMKPAGFEPLETKSGTRYGAGICSNVEFRDTRTAMFVTYLQQGAHTLSYRLRAEIPGTLRTLPARGQAMYAPDIAGTSSSMRFSVLDASER